MEAQIMEELNPAPLGELCCATGTCDTWVHTCLSTCSALLVSIVNWVFLCTSRTWDPSTEADDWSAILVFVIFVKCRHTIGKLLRAEDDDGQ